jgi:TonB-dependent starch-binding outer membrane protein SusC
MKRYLLPMLLMCLSTAVWSQDRTVTGTVTAADDKQPLPGVNVIVEGTTKGTSTDGEGKYSLQLSGAENTIVFSFVGYNPITITVDNRTTIDVALEPDVTSLNEVVVVGYGTQKERDLTSSISTIKADELIKTPSGQAMQGLQGKVAGLQVVSAGAPGDPATIRIRGIGSYPRVSTVTGKSENVEGPLYVVDGMFFDNIDFLNPSDIATISVLKDASSASIYGVRAANGVVLIETKSGKIGQKAQITYDGYYGVQVAQNVLKMANAEQFTNMALESGSPADVTYIQNAMQRYGRSRVNPNVPDVNTDWYEEILRTAPIQNHSLNVAGGGENTSYSIGGSYFNQDGVMDMKNNYERFNLRSKLDYQANDWLTIGGNFILSNAKKYGQDESVWNLAYFAIPVMPVYDENNTDATPIKYAGANDLGYRNGQNPRPVMSFNDNFFKITKLLTNFYVKVDLIPDRLNFQTTYNNASITQTERNVDLPYYLSSDMQVIQAAIQKKSESTLNQIWDNVLTYNQTFGDHNVTVMAGASYRDESWGMVQVKGYDFPYEHKEAWFVDQAKTIDFDNSKDDGSRYYGLSYFGRVSYNFRDKYLLFGTMRADGSSKYQEKWGYFPSIGAGWVISEEDFFGESSAINFLKLRANWGKRGNDKVPASDGANTTKPVITSIGGQQVSGTVTTNTFSWLRWEVTSEFDFGITSKLLNDRLSLDADYFIRDTEDAVIPVFPPFTGGSFYRNVGEIRNSGFELSLNWNDNLSDDFTYNIGANFSTLKNEVLDLQGQAYVDGGSAEFLQRSIVGEPLLAFFGYETAGVYQNAEQIGADPVASALNEASPTGDAIVPGDFIYKDQDGNGVIDADDRVVLGSYLPKFSWGVNLGASYKNFDLSVNLMGQNGNKILNRKRGEVIWTPDQNMDADLANNRWHGDGTTNDYPSSAALRKGWNQKMSDFFVEDGSFFRVQNVQLAYNIRGMRVFGTDMPGARISFTADRPLTMFNYNGFNPEVANGIDTQTYPIPAVYTIGLNVKL